MRTYRIVEDRGCGIVYTTFTGSLKDCKKWLKDNCWYNEHTNDYYSNDPENVIYFDFDDRGAFDREIIYYVQYKLFMEITVLGYRQQIFKTLKSLKHLKIRKNENISNCRRA